MFQQIRDVSQFRRAGSLRRSTTGFSFTLEIRFALVANVECARFAGSPRPLTSGRDGKNTSVLANTIARRVNYRHMSIRRGDAERPRGKRKRKWDRSGGWSQRAGEAVTVLRAIKDSKHRSLYALWKITRLFGDITADVSADSNNRRSHGGSIREVSRARHRRARFSSFAIWIYLWETKKHL